MKYCGAIVFAIFPYSSSMSLKFFSLARAVCVRFLGETRVTTPTATETQLPWKRNEDNAEGLQQNEFPAWASNKEYLAYNSPSATFLGNLVSRNTLNDAQA